MAHTITEWPRAKKVDLPQEYITITIEIGSDHPPSVLGVTLPHIGVMTMENFIHMNFQFLNLCNVNNDSTIFDR